jgi:predicted negative regulator of RcsB-dependent stress response
MTTPTTDTGSLPTREPKATSFMDWFHVNSRWVAAGAAVVAVAAAVAWYVPHQRALAGANADRMLLDAKRSLNSGNTQLAESDLRKVADRYAGTPSGLEAALLIGQLHLQKDDAAGAVSYLQGVVGKADKGTTGAAGAHGLLADALMQAGKTAEAAAEYQKAAEMTALPNEHAVLLSKAGYAYMAGGKTAEARTVFEALATQQQSQALAAEARVRLGELAAAGRS